MLVYTNAKFKPRKKKKPIGELAKKIVLNNNTNATYAPAVRFVPRKESLVASSINSLETVANCTVRNSVMDPVSLAKESPEVREQIIAKSKRIAILYSKGAYQVLTDDTDITTVGRKTAI